MKIQIRHAVEGLQEGGCWRRCCDRQRRAQGEGVELRTLRCGAVRDGRRSTLLPELILCACRFLARIESNSCELSSKKNNNLSYLNSRSASWCNLETSKCGSFVPPSKVVQFRGILVLWTYIGRSSCFIRMRAAYRGGGGRRGCRWSCGS